MKTAPAPHTRTTTRRTRTPHRRRDELWVAEAGTPHRQATTSVETIGPRVLLATELGTASRSAEQRALELAAEPGRDVWVVGIMPADVEPDHRDQDRLEALLRQVRRRGATAQGILVSGDPAVELLREANARGADVVVVGRDQWEGRSRTSVCGHLVNHARCAVLVTA